MPEMPYSRSVSAAAASLMLVLMSASPCRALLWWRDKMASSWAASPVQVDGSDAKWSGVDEVEEPQIDLRALNDATGLYLRLAADGADGRAVLSGAYRQDVTLWFLGPDGKSKDWGIRIPFSVLEPPRSPLRGGEIPAIPEAPPELASMQGVAVSTMPLPQDIQVKSALSGKNPVFEIGVPLQRLKLRGGKSILFDLATSAVSPELQRTFESKRGGGPARSADGGEPSTGGGDGGWNGGGRGGSRGGGRSSGGGRGGGGRRRQGSAQPRGLTFPDPLSLRLSVRLAQPPK